MKARYALAQMQDCDFMFLTFRNVIPMLKTSKPNPRWGYSCMTTTIPDLGNFCDLDFTLVGGVALTKGSKRVPLALPVFCVYVGC